MVCRVGFEPTTPRSQSVCSDQAELRADNAGACTPARGAPPRQELTGDPTVAWQCAYQQRLQNALVRWGVRRESNPWR